MQDIGTALIGGRVKIKSGKIENGETFMEILQHRTGRSKMTILKHLLARRVLALVQLLVLFLLLPFVVHANEAHQLAVSPSHPTSENTITILATGNWRSGGGPSLQQWSRVGQSIRIFNRLQDGVQGDARG